MNEAPEKSGRHAAKHPRRISETDANDVRVRFSEKLTKRFAELYETIKAHDDGGDPMLAITIRGFAEDGGGNLKELINDFARLAGEIEGDGDHQRQEALSNVFYELVEKGSVMVEPIRSQGRRPGA